MSSLEPPVPDALPEGDVQGRLGLPRESRLRQRREFLLVQRNGRRVHTPHFVVIVLPRPSEDDPRRIGVTITKKVANAVGRNRVKRVVREIFRRNQRMFPPSTDVVVIAKSGAPALGYDEALRELTRVEGALAGAARKARRRNA